MTRGRRVAVIGVVAGFLSCACFGSSADEKQGPFFSFTEENDLYSNPYVGGHTDRHYTQGVKFLYLGGDDEVPPWAKKPASLLPVWELSINAENFGYVFGQNMYTPENINTVSPIRNDRPYAGWLYGGLVLQRRGVDTRAQIPVAEDFEIDLGVTGRPSLAEAAQENFHRWIYHEDIPQGWHNQLATEPGLLLKYQRLWRLSLNATTARYIDVIPHVGGEVGNIEVFANLGGACRVGYNLPEDFGVQINDSPASVNGGITPRSPLFAGYLFGAVDGRYVAHNLFLDGNSFRGGPSVDRNPWVADLDFGAAVRLFRHVEVSYTRVLRTQEFAGQDHTDVFGSITAKAMFTF